MAVSWKDFVYRNEKRSGANNPPVAVSREVNGGGKGSALYDPSSFAGPSARNPPGNTQIKGEGFSFMNLLRKMDPTVRVDPNAISDAIKEQNPWGSSDTYYHNILVGGANAGGKGFFGLSPLPFGTLLLGDNRELYRNGDIRGIRSGIERALKAGKNVRVFGHSWGGADVANLAKYYPNVEFIACDPTSWFGVLDSSPKNLTIFRPDNEVPAARWTNRAAQIFGHQWPVIEKGEGRTIVYHGNHVDGLPDALSRYNNDVRSERILRGLKSRPQPRQIDISKVVSLLKRKDLLGAFMQGVKKDRQ